MTNTSEARLREVYPRLAENIHKLASQLLEEGVEIVVSQGIRTIAEQDALYAQGRTSLSSVGCHHNGRTFKPGTCPHHPYGVPITNARGGYSYHNFGLAVDCAPIIPSQYAIDWNSSHPAWIKMETYGVKLGMVNGAHWARLIDAPHFQMTGPFPEGAPTDEVRRLASAGLSVLWNEVGK